MLSWVKREERLIFDFFFFIKISETFNVITTNEPRMVANILCVFLIFTIWDVCPLIIVFPFFLFLFAVKKLK